MGIDNIGSLRRNPAGSLDNLVLDDVESATAELTAYRGVGGDTVVDLTSPDIGRDVQALRTVSRLSGVQIIAGAGHYVQIHHPPTLADETIDDIAERFVAELQDGIGTTGIKAGILGEIGTLAPIRPGRGAGAAGGRKGPQRSPAPPIAVHISPPPRGHLVAG